MPSITAGKLLCLAKMSGGGVESWTNLQRNYDLLIVELDMVDVLAGIPGLKVA